MEAQERCIQTTGENMKYHGKKTAISSAILLALATAQTAVAVEGDALDAGASILVNQSTTGTQHASFRSGGVAMDADGNFVALWSDYDNYDGVDVIARRFNADGSARGDEFVVYTATGDQYANAVAATPDGAFVAVFEDNANGIYARRFDANGDALGDAFQVSTTTGKAYDDAQVAMAADGRFVVVWTIAYPGYTDLDVHYRRYAADGTALDATDVRANTITSSKQSWASIAMDPAGNFVIVWDDDASGDDEIRARRYSADGTALDAAEVQVNETTAGAQNMASVGMDAAGNYVVAWSDFGTGIYFKRFAADGTTLNGETAAMLNVNAGYATNANFWEAHVAMSAGGHFAIASGDYNGADGDGYGAYMQRYDSSGNPAYADAINVGGPAGNDYIASVRMDADGDAVVLYQNYDGDDGDGYGVYAERYEGAGQTVDLDLVGAGDTDTLGGDITYTFTTTNNGSGYALAVKLEDLLPSGVSYISFTSLDDWSCSETGGTVSCSLPSLAPAAQSSIDITVDTSGVTDSSIDNTATITNAVTDSNTSNNSDTVTTGVSSSDSSGGGGALGWLSLFAGLLLMRRRQD